MRVNLNIPHTILGDDGSIVLIACPHQLTHETADDLSRSAIEALSRLDGAGLILDFDGVTLISSIGIAALLEINEAASEGRMVLMGLPAAQARFLEMLRLDRKFRQATALEEATDLLQSER
jgi:anti-anti-sigma factor